MRNFPTPTVKVRVFFSTGQRLPMTTSDDRADGHSSRACHLMRKGSPHPFFLAVAMACTLAACAPQSRIAGGGAGPTLGPSVKLRAGAVKADLKVVGDATAILRESANDSFVEAGVNCPQSAGGCSTLDLEAHLRRPADAFDGVSPPIQIVELLVTYHGSGSNLGSSTLSYQRTIATQGDLSTATWMRVSNGLMTSVADDFAFRSARSGIVVRLPVWASEPTGFSRTSAPKSFHVAVTGDGRADPDAIGRVGDREVRLARPATEYIAELLTDELRGSGHTIVPAKDGRLVGTQLEKFWVASTKNSGGWATTAQIELALEVGPPPGVKRKKGTHHTCTVSGRTSGAPTEPELAAILDQCLRQLILSIRGDEAWSLGSEAPAPKS